jgi:hypothetical protein
VVYLLHCCTVWMKMKYENQFLDGCALSCVCARVCVRVGVRARAFFFFLHHFI